MKPITPEEIVQAVRNGHVTFDLLFKRFKDRACWQWPSHQRYESTLNTAMRGFDRLLQKARKKGLIEYDLGLRVWRAK